MNNVIAWSKANVSGGQQRSELYTFLLTSEKVSDKWSIYPTDCFSLNKEKSRKHCVFVTASLHNARILFFKSKSVKWAFNPAWRLWGKKQISLISVVLSSVTAVAHVIFPLEWVMRNVYIQIKCLLYFPGVVYIEYRRRQQASNPWKHPSDGSDWAVSKTLVTRHQALKST